MATHRIDIIGKRLWDEGTITFNEWVTIAMALQEYRPDPILPKEYEEARQALIKPID